MKDCLVVSIFGAHGAGKSTLARGLIKLSGGCDLYNNCTVTKNKMFTFDGEYKGNSKYGGLDSIKKIDLLVDLINRSSSPVFISEGVYGSTFGVKSLRYIFSAKRQIIIYLKIPEDLCIDRTIKRSKKRSRKRNYDCGLLIKQLERCIEKYKSIYVPVYVVDATKSKEEVLSEVYSIIMGALNGIL